MSIILDFSKWKKLFEQAAEPSSTETQNEFPCNSETINISDSPKIRLSTNQQMGDSKTATPNVLLKEFRTIGGQQRSPLVYIKNLKPKEVATDVQQAQGWRNTREAENVWLSKIEYVKLTDIVTKKSVYFPSFLTLTHMFCAKFKNPESLDMNKVELSSAEPGTQVYNYYRIPVIVKGTFNIESLSKNGLNDGNLLSTTIANTFAPTAISAISAKLFGDNYQVNGINPTVFKTMSDVIISNQPRVS